MAASRRQFFHMAVGAAGAAWLEPKLGESAPQAAEPSQYTLGPDSERQPGVPKGTVTHYKWNSKIFPGAVRDWWLYIPAQYQPTKPACVMVFQDGGGFVKEDGTSRVPIVFDNLIHKRQMPVTVGIFINPGVLPALAQNQRARYNRSFEYDGLSDRYARFLLEEMLPEAARHCNLSSNPNDRAIAGLSSGGICAFTAAWHRPDAFRRVLSFVGSFTGLRGGDIYPLLIRKTEPKPLRVFLQDGSRDLNIYAGNWYINAQAMASALEYAGYDTKFVAGTEDHNMKQGGAIMPDALRWLWRDYPRPIAKPQTSGDRQFSTLILKPGHEWEAAGHDYESAGGLAVDGHGAVYFADPANGRVLRMEPEGRVTIFIVKTGGVEGLVFGPDGRLYACQSKHKHIVAYSPRGRKKVIAKGILPSSLAVTSHGSVYASDPTHHRIWYVSAHGVKRVAHEATAPLSSLQISPDQSLLFASERDGKWIWSFQIQVDGSLADGEPFYRLETSDESSASGAAGMAVDTEGYLYVATQLGVQICDQPGRVVAIINKPGPEPLSGVALAGPEMDMLYVTSGGKVFRRPIRRKGVLAWTLVEPPVPQL